MAAGLRSSIESRARAGLRPEGSWQGWRTTGSKTRAGLDVAEIISALGNAYSRVPKASCLRYSMANGLGEGSGPQDS